MPKTKKQEEKKETKEQQQQTQPQQQIQQSQQQPTTQQQQTQDENIQVILTNIYAKLVQLDEKVDKLRKSLYWHRRLSENSKRKGYYKKNYRRRDSE